MNYYTVPTYQMFAKQQITFHKPLLLQARLGIVEETP